MKATEAKQKADFYNNSKSNDDYDSVIEKIKKAAIKGEYKIILFSGIHSIAIENLKKDGYKVVESMPEMGGYSLTISW